MVGWSIIATWLGSCLADVDGHFVDHDVIPNGLDSIPPAKKKKDVLNCLSTHFDMVSQP
jgi:hypothetical protein